VETAAFTAISKPMAVPTTALSHAGGSTSLSVASTRRRRRSLRKGSGHVVLSTASGHSVAAGCICGGVHASMVTGPVAVTVLRNQACSRGIKSVQHTAAVCTSPHGRGIAPQLLSKASTGTTRGWAAGVQGPDSERKSTNATANAMAPTFACVICNSKTK